MSDSKNTSEMVPVVSQAENNVKYPWPEGTAIYPLSTGQFLVEFDGPKKRERLCFAPESTLEIIKENLLAYS